MGIGASIFLIAVGAILTFAVQADVEGLDLDTIGVILMVAGAVGAVFTAFIWGPRRRTSRETVVHDQPPASRREITREERDVP